MASQLVNIKAKFASALGVPFALSNVKVVAEGTFTPLRVYDSVGNLLSRNGDATTATDGTVNVWVDASKPASFVLLDVAGKEVERTSGISSGDNAVDTFGTENKLLVTTETTAMSGGYERLQNTAPATIAAYTVQLPVVAVNGQKAYISTRGIITALTVTVGVGSGHTLSNPITAAALAAGASAGWQYSSADLTWSRIQ